MVQAGKGAADKAALGLSPVGLPASLNHLRDKKGTRQGKPAGALLSVVEWTH